MNTDLLQAQAVLRTEGISVFPKLPAELAEQLRERGNGIFSTRELSTGPYAMEVHVSEWLQAANPIDYAVLAIDGHGFNSWAFHYFLVSGPLALFIQLPWAGAYTDKEAALAEIEEVMKWAQPLLARLHELQSQGRLDARQKLAVIVTAFSESRWAWVRDHEAVEETQWQRADGMLVRVNEELDALNTQTA